MNDGIVLSNGGRREIDASDTLGVLQFSRGRWKGREIFVQIRLAWSL